MTQGPNFIIIGAMKCATSTMHNQLAVQPGIFMTELKEPNFFSNDEEYAKGMDWYLSLFADAPADALCGESSTHYTKLPTYPETVARMRQAYPDLKLIYVMRHPIDRLVSQYIHEWTQRVIAIDINRAVEKHAELIDYSLYTKQLRPYFETYGADRVLPVFFDRWCSDPQAELERVCQFIGYDRQTPHWQAHLEADNVSSQRMIKSKVRDFLVDTPGLRELRRALVPKSFRNWVKGFWTLKKKPELEPTQIAKLKSIFDPDLDTLGSWLGIENLSCDTWKTTVKETPFNWVNVPQTKS